MLPLATGKYDAMTLVHNETSTGVMSPLQEIAEVMKDYPEVSFIVDTVSSMSAVPIDVSALRTDVCLAGVQKAFGLPPGLAVFSVSERALRKAETTPGRGYYFDFVEFEKNAAKNNTPSTPCLSQIFALDHQLEKMFSEGLEKRYERHRRMAEATREWVLAQGFSLFPEEGYCSMTLTLCPERRQNRLGKIKKPSCRERLCHRQRIWEHKKRNVQDCPYGRFYHGRYAGTVLVFWRSFCLRFGVERTGDLIGKLGWWLPTAHPMGAAGSLC